MEGVCSNHYTSLTIPIYDCIEDVCSIYRCTGKKQGRNEFVIRL
jgi:hypothetical protein